jgi:hypothetical protein
MGLKNAADPQNSPDKEWISARPHERFERSNLARLTAQFKKLRRQAEPGSG